MQSTGTKYFLGDLREQYTYLTVPLTFCHLNSLNPHAQQRKLNAYYCVNIHSAI